MFYDGADLDCTAASILGLPGYTTSRASTRIPKSPTNQLGLMCSLTSHIAICEVESRRDLFLVVGCGIMLIHK